MKIDFKEFPDTCDVDAADSNSLLLVAYKASKIIAAS
jgi:hypothetical protein